MRVAVVDYGAGNLRSVARALGRAGAEARVIQRPEDAVAPDAIVLPGVGAFGSAMRRLAEAGFPGWLRDRVASGVPLIGLCLGMQVLFEWGEEGGGGPGLGLLPGAVRRLPAGLKVPHMGWNSLSVRRRAPVLDGVADGAYAYFVHSYVVEPADPSDVVATSDYGVEFPAVVQRRRVVGLQFHPEKSGEVGAAMLRGLVGWLARP